MRGRDLGEPRGKWIVWAQVSQDVASRIEAVRGFGYRYRDHPANQKAAPAR